MYTTQPYSTRKFWNFGRPTPPPRGSPFLVFKKSQKIIKTSKNKILWNVPILSDILVKKISKHEFRLILKKNVMKSSNGSRFCIRRRKKSYNISKRSSQRGDSDFNGLWPFRNFLESQNSKGRYESRKILGFRSKNGNFWFFLIFLNFFCCLGYFLIILNFWYYFGFLDFLDFFEIFWVFLNFLSFFEFFQKNWVFKIIIVVC